jgi:hypothetical protein
VQDLHWELRDGRIEHREFTRSSWEEGLANHLVRSQWTHSPGNCSDPFVEGLRVARQSELVQSLPESPAPPEQFEWPPATALQSWMLQQMTTLGADDARAVLSGPRKQGEVERRPVADKRGQFSLF